MVCKEEVALWFKELESYKRIDAMCTLLNMCLPFELRFLGTCLEELGGRDSKELRGIELRVNNSNELSQEIASSQLCDPSDIKVRRKMALYFALIRACNRPCVNELFNILCSWSNNEFLKRAKADALQELLLVYTMAANHPVFSFEQRMKCGEIYNSILSGNPEISYADVPVVDNVHTKSVNEANSSSSSNIVYSQKHVQGEQIMPMFAIPNPSGNVTQVAFDQNRGPQIIHREVVNIAPHHIYAEGVQPGFHHNIANVCQTTTPNVASFTASRSSQQQQQQQQQQAQAATQQHINTSSATNLTYSLQNLSLVDNNLVYVHSDGIPIMRKSESESISSGESIEDSTPPDTPLNTDISNSGISGSSNSSSNKKFKVRGDPKLSSRHKVSAQHQPPQQILYTHIMPQIPASAALSSEIVLAPPNVSQSQSQQTIPQSQPPQPTPQTMQTINSPAPIQAIGIASPQVLFQQYAQPTHPLQKSQMNQTYPYTQQHLPMNNRSAILSPNTTTSAVPQSAVQSYRLPSYHMQPNGDVIYQLPSTFAYMPQTALPLTRPPSTCNQTHTVVPTMQHLPTLTSLSSKTNQNAMVSPFLLANENAKPNTSCFNCGSSQHTGQECQEASMEDVTRGIYKLDYNSTLVNDTLKSTELDNGSGGGGGGSGGSIGVKTTDSITHMSSSVVNK
ncbi:zinc finger CCHC domain-containing protein 2 [Contarinia nasturtii]|uniref:zinc finger CCHC domain-containing protein 2 n=1 Tax=Contarinia nasturtii TaxID=265458 RepID=UPI0012D3C254|nr:zinc finger CCHC domain-containing protein 2 [Contarinia nasturtii]